MVYVCYVDIYMVPVYFELLDLGAPDGENDQGMMLTYFDKL